MESAVAVHGRVTHNPFGIVVDMRDAVPALFCGVSAVLFAFNYSDLACQRLEFSDSQLKNAARFTVSHDTRFSALLFEKTV